MNIDNWKQSIPSNFPDQSSVWIYQTDKLLTIEQQQPVQQQINTFTSNWLSHKQPVKGWGTILFNRFIVLMADETVTQVSGCSKDSMMHFIQSLEKEYHLNLLDRTELAFLENDQIKIIPLNILPEKIDNGEINKQTIYFNNTIANKNQLLHEWMIEAQHSWIKQKFDFQYKTY